MIPRYVCGGTEQLSKCGVWWEPVSLCWSGGCRPPREEARRIHAGWIGVEDIHMHSRIAEYRHTCLHIAMFLDICAWASVLQKELDEV